MYRKKHLSLSVSAALGLTSFMMIPGAALAQDQQTADDSSEVLEEVIVTGSRLISEDGFGQVSPVTVVGMEDISSYGLTRVEDVLNNLPQIEASNTAFDSNGATGTASIDLRGLGTNRTLVLLNGRRMQNGGVSTESVDVNQIPTMMIERVEVLTGGASATYGADAVAGVVNFIMRRMNGVEFSAGYSGYQHKNGNKYIQGLMDERGFEYPTGSSFDGKAYNIEIAAGGDFADGRGNATVFATWRQNDGLLQGERDYSSCALNAAGNSCGGSGNAVVPNFAIYSFGDDGELDGASGQYVGLQPDGTLGSTTIYNYNPINFYMRPQTQWTAGAFVDFEINENAVAYAEVMMASNETRGQIAESGTFFFEAYDLPVDNAYFPQPFRDSLAELFPGEDRLGIYIGKRNVEGGPRSDVLKYDSHRIVAGVKGAINDDWDYDVNYLHAQSSSSSTYINDFLAPSIAQAVDASLCEPDPTCIPYQVFTYQGVTPEAAAAMGGTAIRANVSKLDAFEAVVTGDSGFGFSAGNIMVAGGFQWLQQKYDTKSDTLYELGLLLGQGGPQPSVAGTIRSKQLFAEANVPLLADAAFAQNMSLDLAYRWADYNTTGSNSTYRVGLDWQVVDAFRFRTGYNRAVRAPSVAELFSVQNIGLWSGVDPCATANPVYSEAQCANTGVLPGQYGNISASPAGQYNALYGGNPLLQPEKADTYTVGVVVNPTETMQFSVDWWQIKIKDTISNVFAETSLTQCAENGASPLCDNISRGNGGTLWLGQSGFVTSTNQNIGTQKWSGVDLAWAWQLGDNWNFDMIGTYTLKKETTPIPDQADSAFDCKGVISPRCYPNPEWRHTATGTYDSGSWWALTARWRYLGKVKYEGTTDLIVADNTKAKNYVDLNAVFRFMDTNDVVVGVNNIFDKEPPLMGNTISGNGNTIVGFYDTLGRYMFADVTFRW
ncbi:MAG: TonB-dependent receptor [Xanthomonadales bacterium]|nr:TonB-dependent receptor [Gammaproteobacteria bacterium]MBT8054851.1 TonB-dependent receptor [Gammaproteobacteria bacterium]NND58532.1 TonB-dependent receptor [Xanthomonadales bacterium]NNK51116.1 TonB-dependent receptor [Xanthomonadales bacterium]